LDAALSSHLLDPGERDVVLARNELVIELPSDNQPAQRRHGHRPVWESYRRRDLQP
jgi:hypothetical protein